MLLKGKMGFVAEKPIKPVQCVQRGAEFVSVTAGETKLLWGFVEQQQVGRLRSVTFPTYTGNPRITRLIRSEKSSRNTKTRKVNN